VEWGVDAWSTVKGCCIPMYTDIPHEQLKDRYAPSSSNVSYKSCVETLNSRKNKAGPTEAK